MSTLRKEVILDFDYTLFDAKRFKQALADSLVKLGVPADAFFAFYPRAIRRVRGQYHYSIEQHIALLRRVRPHLPVTKARERLSRVVQQSYRYLYPGTGRFLQSLRRHGFRLLLVTHGNPTFQRAKLRYSGLRPYFVRVVLSQELKVVTLKRLGRNYDEVFFVSDHAAELEQVKRHLPTMLPVMKLGGHHGDLAAARRLRVPAFSHLRQVERYVLNYQFRKDGRGYREPLVGNKVAARAKITRQA